MWTVSLRILLVNSNEPPCMVQTENSFIAHLKPYVKKKATVLTEKEQILSFVINELLRPGRTEMADW